MEIFVWDRRFLLHAASFVLPRAAKPHKRLSATVLIARNQPFAMEGIGKPGQRFQGVIIAPNVPRLSLEAAESDLYLLDAGITTEAYRKLRTVLVPGGARELTQQELSRVKRQFEVEDAPLPGPLPIEKANGERGCNSAAKLFDCIVDALTGPAASKSAIEPRLERAMKLVESLPLDELSLPLLAREAGVSPSRLRSLFQQSFGCAPAQYMRWVNAWKAIRAWRRGVRLTDVAHEAGFHDLAHIDHAVRELFGMSPSMIALAKDVRFQQCE
jgi:AraC-like DNA-binding protein